MFKGATRLIVCVALLAAVLAAWGCGGGAAGYRISVYTRSDACGAADTWALYLDGHKQEDLKGTGLRGEENSPGASVILDQEVRDITSA